MKNLKSISIFGDSIMKGIVLGEDNRYKIGSTLDLDRLGQEHGVNIVNKSKFGCTVEKGFSMLKRSVDKGQHWDATLLEYGGNDCDFNWGEVSNNPAGEFEPNTTLDKFVDIYGQMIDYLRTKGITPILTKLPPINAQKYFNWICRGEVKRENVLSWLGDVSAIYRYQEIYSDAVEELAKDKGVQCIDMRTVFLLDRGYDDLFCADGIHPSEKGQGKIRACLEKFIVGSRGLITA